MTKIALLIGVSEYQSGLQSLSATGRDVEAVRQVLQDPEIGAFAPTDITTLLNPDPQQMREALAILFRDRRKDDVLLLYFSGHGITDEQGNFYLTCAQTKPELLEATAIPASYVHGLMENSRSERQIVVLDSCFSGAFAKGMGVKGAAVNLAAQLGGQGRAVLTSSSATEYSFEQKKADLSVYTRYWVEGLQTGTADEDDNGWISVEELHSYAYRKVREAAPAMKPQIYAAKEGFKIILAKAPVGDPQLEYRKEVERLAHQRKGQFSEILLDGLNETRKRLALPVETAQAIQDEVLEPYQQLQKKLQRYEQAVNSALRSAEGLNQATLNDLSYLRQALGLRDADVASINNRIPRPIPHPTPTQQTIHAQNELAVQQRNSKVQLVLGILIAVAIGGNVIFSWFFASKGAFPFMDSLSTFLGYSQSAEDLLAKGLEKYDEGDYQGAITACTEAIRLKSNYARAYNCRGIGKAALGNYQEAIADYNIAIQINQNWDDIGLWATYTNRGDTKAALSNTEGAISDYSEAIRLKPDYVAAYVNRGNIKASLGDTQGAMTDYNEAIRLQPDYSSTYIGRGNTRANLCDAQGAIADYTEAIRLQPNYAPAYINRGNAKRNLGDAQGAIADYTEAIRLQPNYAPTYVERGNSRSDLGDTQGAIADYTEAILIKSDYARAFYNRGFVKANSGDKQGALEDYQEAANLYQQQDNTEDYRKALDRLEQLKK